MIAHVVSLQVIKVLPDKNIPNETYDQISLRDKDALYIDLILRCVDIGPWSYHDNQVCKQRHMACGPRPFWNQFRAMCRIWIERFPFNIQCDFPNPNSHGSFYH